MNTAPRPAPSWLAEIAPTYEARHGAGSFPWGEAGKHLKPLHNAGHTTAKIAEHLGRYLAKTEPQFVSLARFAKTFDAFAPFRFTGPPVVNGWMSAELERLTRPDGLT